MDNIFNLFPLVFFDTKNLFNVSCDRIVPKTPEWQLLPLFLNYAKMEMNIEQFMEALKKRNFLQNTINQKVIIPDQYRENSYFIDKLNKINT